MQIALKVVEPVCVCVWINSQFLQSHNIQGNVYHV